MRAAQIIARKRDGQALSEEEITGFIDAYTREDIPDYQAAAWLMAVYLRGMTPAETTALTLAMAHSGEVLDLSDVIPYAVDKHSSGGVGDKTSLVVLPLVAACGVPVAKMSGRGLGHTGGTLDKIEAIPGFSVDLSEADFRRIAAETGLVLAGQTRALAPADGKLYALRDVTATVSSLPLIASSIMSKKIAAGASGIVLDVKTGNGAFMASVDEARMLAGTMVEIGQRAGRDVIALISDMNQPLGHAVGNALEVLEAIETLSGGGPADLREHCLEVAAHMLALAGRGETWTDSAATKSMLAGKLADGSALAKFRAMVVAQGGDPAYVDDTSRLAHAAFTEAVTAPQTGYISAVSAIQVAQAALELGAGREKKGDPIDLAVGIVVTVKVGDAIGKGEPVAKLHANDESKLAAARTALEGAISYTETPVDPLPLFYDVIKGD